MDKILALIHIDSLDYEGADVDSLEGVKDDEQHKESALRLARALITSKGGDVSLLHTGELALSIDVDNILEIKELHSRLNSDLGLTSSVGVGETLEDARAALRQADGNIKVYSSDMESETAQPEQTVATSEETEMKKAEPEWTALNEEEVGKIKQMLEVVSKNKESLEQLSQANPDIYRNVLAAIKALTAIMQEDKVNQEKDLEKIITFINRNIETKGNRNARKVGTEINREINKKHKADTEESKQRHLRAFNLAKDNHKKTLKRAKEFTDKNGGDHRFLANLIGKF